MHSHILWAEAGPPHPSRPGTSGTGRGPNSAAAVRQAATPRAASVGSLADFEDMLALTRLFVADQAARL